MLKRFDNREVGVVDISVFSDSKNAISATIEGVVALGVVTELWRRIDESDPGTS